MGVCMGIGCTCEHCTTCAKRRYKNKIRSERPDVWRDMKAKYRRTQSGREGRRRSRRLWVLRNPEKQREKDFLRDSIKVKARNDANNAIKMGLLVRALRCSMCGTGAKCQAHHADYSKPLEVTWLCSPCHAVVDGFTKRLIA